jgi:hypothetical protein
VHAAGGINSGTKSANATSVCSERAAGFTTSHLVRKTRALAFDIMQRVEAHSKKLRATRFAAVFMASANLRAHLGMSNEDIRPCTLGKQKTCRVVLLLQSRHFSEEKSSLLLCLTNGRLVFHEELNLPLLTYVASCSFAHSYSEWI